MAASGEEQSRSQRRGRAIAMSAEERDAFLAEERTCRMATMGAQGPHATPLWFHWDTEALWLISLTRSQRWTDIENDPRVAVIVDAGTDYAELRGVELRGTVEPVGEIPRTGEPNPEIDRIERAFADKYTHGHVVIDGKHGWLRLRPDKIVSWDFRKVPTSR